jgi:ketosteroid isomerase-like protein
MCSSASGRGTGDQNDLASRLICAYDAAGPSTATRGREEMPGNEQKIIELDRQRMAAMAEKDVATLNRLLADDLIYTHSSARLDTKKSLIGAMESGSTVYTSVEPSEVVAQDLGDSVVLTGVAAISVNSGGKPNSFHVRFTDVYANRGGQWQMVTWQSTRLG